MPFIGFYGNGEIGPLKDGNHTYQYSASLGLFKIRGLDEVNSSWSLCKRTYLSLYGKDRVSMRQVFFTTWQKYKQSLPLQGIEPMLIDTILLHPEYHAILDDADSHLDRDYPPEQGDGKPVPAYEPAHDN